LIVPIGKHKNQSEAIDLTNESLERRRAEPFRLLDRSAPISIPIDLARETKRRLAIQAATGITRVVVFYQMEKMRASSADALLKLIEEPPANTILILTAVRPESLLDTILSRSQKIRLERLPEPMVVDYLVERYQVSQAQAQLAARISEQSLGRAIAAASTDSSEGSDARSVGLLLFKTLFTEPASAVVSQMSDLLNLRDRGGAEDLIRLWQSLFRDGAYFAGTADDSAFVNVDFASEIKQFSGQLTDPTVIERLVATTKNTLADLTLNVHIQPALVAMALKLKAYLEMGDRANAQ
jgi:DNA polymerase-3 subunit delta'